MSELYPAACGASFGSLAKLAAIRRASFLVSILAAESTRAAGSGERTFHLLSVNSAMTTSTIRVANTQTSRICSVAVIVPRPVTLA
jgi:hypothetical protein